MCRACPGECGGPAHTVPIKCQINPFRTFDASCCDLLLTGFVSVSRGQHPAWSSSVSVNIYWSHSMSSDVKPHGSDAGLAPGFEIKAGRHTQVYQVTS